MFHLFFSMSFFILFIKATSEFEFSDLRAHEYWFYQIMTECKSERIQAWDVAPMSSLYPNISNINVFYNSTGSNIGYVAYNPQSNVVFMSFGGTHNIENWLEDFDALKINYDRCEGCEIHEGFAGAYGNLKDEILGAFLTLAHKFEEARKTIIGHSLGAAMATLAFLDLGDIIHIDDFYTFGSPRVGNEKFTDFFNSKNQNTVKARITHYRDPVPHLAFSLMGYRHVDREVFYNENSTQFRVCGNNIEDPNCSLQFEIYEIDPNDHTSYMGFDLKPVKKNCA